MCYSLFYCRGGGIISKEVRVNREIRARQVRVIGAEGEQLGVLSVKEAVILAEGRGLDLVEVSPNVEPPVCKLMDYGKFRYEQAKKEKEAKVKKKTLDTKELKMRPKIDEHDFLVKRTIAERMLSDGDKVKVTLMFKGREVAYAKNAQELMVRLSEELSEKCVVERAPKLEGRNMIMILAPK